MFLLKDLLGILELAGRELVKVVLVGVPVLVLLIAVLARRACACQTVETAYATAMRSELRNIVQFQDAYRAQHGEMLDSLRLRTDFRWSTGVILVYMRPTADGFTAEVAYPERTRNRCRVTHSWGTEPSPTCDWMRRPPRRLF
jgi:hypothetical protein